MRQDWWKLYNDPTLTSLEESALKTNYGIAAAMQRVEQARQSAAIANAGFYPVITFNPQISRSRTPASSGGTGTRRTAVGKPASVSRAAAATSSGSSRAVPTTAAATVGTASTTVRSNSSDDGSAQ